MTQNSALILLGSNIQPRENLINCYKLLSREVNIVERSKVWKTKAVGSEGPDFLNAAIKIMTDHSADNLDSRVLKKIEKKLNRVRTEDKYAPRTIDLDIMMFNGKVIDDNIWRCMFIAVPASELEPNILHPKYDITLVEIVKKITSSKNVELVEDFLYTD